MKVGDALPTLEIPITRTLIVAGALASRDFQDVHHDAEVAKSSGAKDIFMNILTTQGTIGRLLTEWDASKKITGMKLRLGVPMYPDDTLTLSGSVTEIDGEAITVEIRGANSLGDHVTGTVTLR